MSSPSPLSTEGRRRYFSPAGKQIAQVGLNAAFTDGGVVEAGVVCGIGKQHLQNEMAMILINIRGITA